jgi:threonine aldolase
MIDLRSDTVTRPTEAMRQAMREATFGDDSRDGDPTVSRLEALAAGHMGKEAGLFMPSGTMTNLVAVLTHAQRGAQVLVEAQAHMLVSELGGMAALAGAVPRGIAGRRGAMDLDALEQALRAAPQGMPGVGLICVENTHNGAGGAVLPREHMASVHALALGAGIPVHLDGARIFNAAVASKTPAGDFTRHADSVCFCLSKGLSSPVGSVLCGDAGFISRARAFRRMVGGSMRQAGPLAAAGCIALDTMVARLQVDHDHARRLAAGLHRIDRTLVDPGDVETNIVRVDVGGSSGTAAMWSAALKENGILVSPCAAHALRFVTHRHITTADVDETISAFAKLWERRAANAHPDASRA